MAQLSTLGHIHTMTFAEAIEIEDAQIAMGELSVLLAIKASTQVELSASERAIHDISWLYGQVMANGFD